MRVTRPLFRIDPGWLFVAAGLSIIAAALLIPAHMQLHRLDRQVKELNRQEDEALARLRAYSDFLATLEAGDPALLRRLATAQLNLAPAGDVPLLIAASASQPVTAWVESTVDGEPALLATYPRTILGTLVTGPYRQWLLALASVLLFVGLILDTNEPATAAQLMSISNPRS